jgi:ankyrin repeat protein
VAAVSEQLFEAIDQSDVEKVRGLVEAEPELAGARDDEDLSAVRYAVYRGAEEIASVLLDANPGLDAFDAAAVGRTRGLEELVAAEPELVRAWSPDGFTPLHLAAFFGHADAVELLLDRGADVNVLARNTDLQVAPLHSAAAGAHAEIVRMLVERGADVNARQRGGFTALQSAAQNGDDESVELLLERGADPTARNDDGKSAADLAQAAGHDELAARLTSPPG